MFSDICQRLLSPPYCIEWGPDDDAKAMALELVKYDFDRVCQSNAHLDANAIGDFFVDTAGRMRTVSALDVANEFRINAQDAGTIVKFIELTFDVPSAPIRASSCATSTPSPWPPTSRPSQRRKSSSPE